MTKLILFQTLTHFVTIKEDYLGGREVAEDVTDPVEELEGGAEDAQSVVEELDQEVEEEDQQGPGVVDQVGRTDLLRLGGNIDSDDDDLES